MERVVTVVEGKGGREVLTLVVLVILAALWAVVLLPPLLRSRSERRTGDSIGDFNYRLDALGRTNGNAAQGGPRRPVPPAAKRRRDVLRVLAALVGVTGVVAFATDAPPAWALNAFADIAFVAFCGLWAWARSMRVERAEKVRMIPAARRRASAHPAELALRRVASS